MVINLKYNLMKKELLFISILFNVLFLLCGSYIIHKKGGFSYLKALLSSSKNEYGASYNLKRNIYKVMPQKKNAKIFLGNSIMSFCDWGELLNDLSIINRGISGDLIPGIIERLEDITANKPQKIFLMIGINDLQQGKSIETIISEYESLVLEISKQSPTTVLYLHSILPTDNKETRKNRDIEEINIGIKGIATKYELNYINLFDLLKNDTNNLHKDYSYDGLHINGKAYLVWKDVIKQHVKD